MIVWVFWSAKYWIVLTKLYNTFFLFLFSSACHSPTPLCPKLPLLAAILWQQTVRYIIKNKYNIPSCILIEVYIYSLRSTDWSFCQIPNAHQQVKHIPLFSIIAHAKSNLTPYLWAYWIIIKHWENLKSHHRKCSVLFCQQFFHRLPLKYSLRQEIHWKSSKGSPVFFFSKTSTFFG